MKTRKGQAHTIILEAVHQLGRIVLRLCLLALAVLGLFAFSLSRHPMELPHLASWLATKVSGDGISVQVAQAELAWAGYSEGAGVPFVLRVSGIAVRSAAGALLLDIPSADLVVPPTDLFGGRDGIELRGQQARLSGTQAPVTISAKIVPGSGYTLARGEFFVTIGPGVLGYGGAGVPISGASFTVLITPGAVDVPGGTVALAPRGGSAPQGHFSFTARRDKNWAGSLHARVDAVSAEALEQYWPAPVLHLTRAWVLRNITAGVARNADFTFSLTAPGNLSNLDLANVTGSFAGDDLTLYWLHAAMPITGLNGSFSMPDIGDADITATSGQVGNVVIRQGQMNITGLNKHNQLGTLHLNLAGTVTDVLTVLNAPPLALLRNGPPELGSATGQAEGTLTALIPFKQNLTFDEVHLEVAANIHNVLMPSILPPLGAAHGEVQLQTDGHSLQVNAQAEFAGEPAHITLAESFAGAGKDGAGTEDLAVSGLAGPQIWHWLGIDSASALNNPAGGTAPFTLHITGTATGAQTAVLNADLTPAVLAMPAFGWAKAAGVKGDFTLTALLRNGVFETAQNFAAQAPGLDVAGVQQNGVLHLSTVTIGRTQASGTLTPPGAPGAGAPWASETAAPAAPGAGWLVTLSGPVLDIREAKQSSMPPSTASSQQAAGAAAAVPTSGPAWSARLNFTQLYLAPDPAPALGQFLLTATGRGSTLLRAEGGAEGLDISITPHPPISRTLVLHSNDAGLLLRVLGDYGHMQGGTLSLTSVYGGGAPAEGHATLLAARFVNAPDVTKLLQGLTLYGLADAASGPGLKISRAEIPFTLQYGVLTLHQARAFSSSLGFTASGTLDLGDNVCDLDTTIVPLYVLNALPGKIPIIGHLFSAEKGGGLLAMRAHITGRLDNATVRINPLSALTPGFLRDIFGL
jgi:hypothetical protein